jgi:hypothetical protein
MVYLQEGLVYQKNAECVEQRQAASCGPRVALLSRRCRVFFTLKQRLYAICAIEGPLHGVSVPSVLVVHGHPDRADW